VRPQKECIVEEGTTAVSKVVCRSERSGRMDSKAQRSANALSVSLTRSLSHQSVVGWSCAGTEAVAQQKKADQLSPAVPGSTKNGKLEWCVDWRR
jgi:hypothetical protein